MMQHDSTKPGVPHLLHTSPVRKALCHMPAGGQHAAPITSVRSSETAESEAHRA